MSVFIAKKLNVDVVQAKKIQKKYFYEYGTTLAGLMKNEGIDPYSFLEFVHDIDISWLPKDIKLKEELMKLKEKKYIFSNGSHAHINNVTKQLGKNLTRFRLHRRFIEFFELYRKFSQWCTGKELFSPRTSS